MGSVLLDVNTESEAMLALDKAARDLNAAIERAAELDLSAYVAVHETESGRACVKLVVRRCQVTA